MISRVITKILDELSEVLNENKMQCLPEALQMASAGSRVGKLIKLNRSSVKIRHHKIDRELNF